MRIAHVIGQRPDSTGSGFYLQELIRRSARSGHDNFLICGVQADYPPRMTGIAARNLASVLFEDTGYPEKIVGMSDVMPYPSRSFRQLDDDELQAYLDRFRTLLVSRVPGWQPDLIHCHHLWLLTSLVRSLFPDIPVVARCHGSELRQFRQCPHLRERVVSGCRGLDRVFSLSRSQREEISQLYGIPREKIVRAGAGFDENRFQPGPRPPFRGITEVLYAGKISRAKGVPWLLRALAAFEAKPFHLHLAGSGAGEEYRECLQLGRRLEGCITFHGALSQDELAGLMRLARVFILPSLHEGLPLVVLEALASGCRVITTALPGAEEIQSHLATPLLRLIRPPRITDTDRSEIEDDDAFIEAIHTALAAEFRRGDQDPSPPPALSRYTWEAVFRRVESAWLELGEARPPHGRASDAPAPC